MATSAPAWASRTAIARPIPRLPPVTSARLPRRSIATPWDMAASGRPPEGEGDGTLRSRACPAHRAEPTDPWVARRRTRGGARVGGDRPRGLRGVEADALGRVAPEPPRRRHRLSYGVSFRADHD